MWTYLHGAAGSETISDIKFTDEETCLSTMYLLPVSLPWKTVWDVHFLWLIIYLWINTTSCKDMSIRVAQTSKIARFMGPTWGPPGSCRPQMGPTLAPWTLVSGMLHQNSKVGYYVWSKYIVNLLYIIDILEHTHMIDISTAISYQNVLTFLKKMQALTSVFMPLFNNCPIDIH